MTPITRRLRLVLVLGTLVAPVGLVALTPASASTPAVDPLHQHITISTFTTLDMRRDPSFYGTWTSDATPAVFLRGSNGNLETTTFTADTPAPGLALSGSRGYCLTQTYSVRTLFDGSAGATYRTTLEVRRHGRVVVRHIVGGAYRSTASVRGTAPGPLITQREPVRLGSFRFRDRDRVTWSISGSLTNDVKKFRTTATITPTCAGARRR